MYNEPMAQWWELLNGAPMAWVRAPLDTGFALGFSSIFFAASSTEVPQWSRVLCPSCLKSDDHQVPLSRGVVGLAYVQCACVTVVCGMSCTRVQVL